LYLTDRPRKGRVRLGRYEICPHPLEIICFGMMPNFTPNAAQSLSPSHDLVKITEILNLQISRLQILPDEIA
jgi:hypothetical protein